MCCWGTSINHSLIRNTLSIRLRIEASSTIHTKRLLELAGVNTTKSPNNGKTMPSKAILQLVIRLFTCLVIHREYDLRLNDAKAGHTISQTTKIIIWKGTSASRFKIIDDSSQNIGEAIRLLASRFGMNTQSLSQKAIRIRTGGASGILRSRNRDTPVQPELIKLFSESQADLTLTIISHGFAGISSSSLEYCMLADMLRERLPSTTIYIILLANIREMKKSPPLGLIGRTTTHEIFY